MFNPLRKHTVVGFGLLLLAAALFPAGNLDKIEQIDTSKFNPGNPYISIHFRVFDNNGEFIRDLKPGDIELKVNNVKQRDYLLKRDFFSDQWLLVMTVVDTSGSMKGKPMIDEKNALKTFAQNLGIYDKIALITFNENPVLLIPFTRDKPEFAAKIDTIMTGGNTSLYDAIALALKQVSETPAPRKAVVVISDGKDTASKIKYEKLLNIISQTKFPVYTIGLGKRNEKVLKGISHASAGIYFFSPTSADLLDIYFKIGENLKNIYVIENLKLLDVETTPDYKIEITNRETGKTMIHHHIPLSKTTGIPRESIKQVPSSPKSTFRPRNFKQLLIGKNKYVTVGLIFFILIFILLTWIFFRGRFLFLKLMVTMLLIFLYVVLQAIFFIIIRN